MNLPLFKRIIISLCISFILLLSTPLVVQASLEKAVLAGGCFWCLEHDLEELQGIISVESGYTGGKLENPTYQNHKGHQEAVIVNFDTKEITFEKLLRSYWRNIDPLDSKGQFCDRGDSYRPVIFPRDESQLKKSIESLAYASTELSIPVDEIKVEIKNAGKFWEAEGYHQDFAKNNNVKYNFYRFSCGRDKRLNEVWGSNSGSGSPWTTKN